MLCQRVPSCAPAREEKAWIAPGLSRWAGLVRAHRRIDSFQSKLGVQNAPFFAPWLGRTIYYFHFLWIHFLNSFCAVNEKPYTTVGSRSYFLRSFCVLDRHHEPRFTFIKLCRLHLTSMLFCSCFVVFFVLLFFIEVGFLFYSLQTNVMYKEIHEHII